MEFSSDRKRMSILIKDPQDETYKLYMKGADTIVKDRLAKEQNKEIEATVDDFLKRCSQKGFRSLVMAMKVVSQEEVDEFNAKIAKAEEDLDNKNELLEEIYSDFEKEMVLIGASGVEDKL